MAADGLDGLAARRDLVSVIEARMRADAVPGLSVAVVSGGSVCWQRGFGRADLASGAPAGPATPYLWFSCSAR